VDQAGQNAVEKLERTMDRMVRALGRSTPQSGLRERTAACLKLAPASI
jgi:hypothetical protein